MLAKAMVVASRRGGKGGRKELRSKFAELVLDSISDK